MSHPSSLPAGAADSEFVSRAVGQALAEARIRSTSERQRALALARASHKEREQFLEDRIEELEDHLAESRKQCRQTEADTKVVAEQADQIQTRADSVEAQLKSTESSLADAKALADAQQQEMNRLAEIVDAHTKCPRQMDDLRREVTTAVASSRTLAAEKAALEAKLADLTSDVESGKADNTSLSTELDGLRGEFAVAVGRVGELQRELDQQREHDESANSERLAEAEGGREAAETEVARLTEELARVQADLDASTEKAVGLEMQKDRDAARAATSAQQSSERITRLEEALAAVTGEKEALMEQMAAKTSALDGVAADHGAQLEELRAAVKAAEEDRDIEVASASTHSAALERQIQDRDAALRAARADLAAVEAQLEAKGDQASHHSAQLAALEAKLASKADALSAAQANASDAMRRVEDAGRKAAAAAAEADEREAALKQALARVEKDLERKNREVRDASSIATTSSKQLVSREEDLTALRDKVAVLEKDVSKKNKALVSKRSQSDVLRRELETKDQSVIDLSNKINDLTKELAARDRTVRYNEKQYTAATLELKAERDEAVEAANTMQARLEELERQVEAAEDETRRQADLATGMMNRVRAHSEETSRLKADLLQSRSVVQQTTEQLETMTAQATANATDRDTMASQLAAKDRSLSSALTLIKELETKQEALQAAVEEARRAAAIPSPTTSGLLSLARRRDTHVLFMLTGDPERLVPVRVAVGSEMICNVNKFVCRLLLQHQIALQDTYQHFAKEDEMQFPEFLAMARAFSLVPDLCTPQELEQVFTAVNASEAADDDASALDSEEFAELLVRLAVMYAPGTYVFGNSDEDLATNPDYGVAFQELLRHLHNHRPDALKTGLAFPEKTSPVRRAGASGGAGGDSALAWMPHAQLRAKVSGLEAENMELRRAVEAHDAAADDERQALRQLVNVKSMELHVAEARIGALSALLPPDEDDGVVHVEVDDDALTSP